MNLTTSPNESDREHARVAFKMQAGLQARAAKALGITRASMSEWVSGKLQSARLDREVPLFLAGVEASNKS